MYNGEELDLSKFEIIDEDESADIYQQLARKDKYLVLAAEAGKTLLDKNRALESTIQYLNGEMMHKAEELERTRYTLNSFYSHRETDHQMQLHNLQYDYDLLLKEFEELKRNKKLLVDSNTKDVMELSNQIEVMKEELNIANSKNNEFSLQVQTLKRRIEGRANAAVSNYAEDMNMMEFKMATEQIKKLQSEKREMQATLDEWASDKIKFIEEAEKSNDTILLLEQRNKYLEQQISIAKSDLDATKSSNIQLNEQLEEYILRVSTSGFKASNSLLSELESSLIQEGDMKYFDENMHGSDRFEPISISSPKKPNGHSSQPVPPNHVVSSHVSDATEQPYTDTPIRKESMEDLQRQIAELNQKMNESSKSYERLSTKYSLTTKRLKYAETKLEEMQQQVNSMEREVELYKNEREIIFSESSLDERLSLSLEQQHRACEERNVALDKLEEAKSDLTKLNNQLLEAVQQKLDLAEQLEMWQVDVAALIDRQLKNSSKRERKEKSRSLFFPGKWSWTSVMKPH